MVCVSVSELSRVIRFTATSGFLWEPQPDYVAHTDLSRHYLLRMSLSDAVLFFGDAVFSTTLNTPLTTQSQGQARHVSNIVLSNAGPGMKLPFNPHRYQPKLKRQANAFQRQILRQALASGTTTADLLELWIGKLCSDNVTVVQICCDSEAIAWEIARRHPQLYFVTQMPATDMETPHEISENGFALDHMTIQHCVPMTAQRMTDAALYIVHLPSPSILVTPSDILSQATQMLWIHFDILRQNRYSKLVLVANGLVGCAKANSKAEVAARTYDLLLMQMTMDNHAITMEKIEQLVNTVQDASSRLTICTKEISDSHPTVAFEVSIVTA